MMLRAAILIAAFAGGAALAAVATAGTTPTACSVGKPRAAMLALLQRGHNERPVHIGVTDKGEVVEVVATESGSTWSIVISSPYGCSRLLADGFGWDRVPPPLAGEES
jgi:hypothetical protein